jgi:hypothetical protein
MKPFKPMNVFLPIKKLTAIMVLCLFLVEVCAQATGNSKDGLIKRKKEYFKQHLALAAEEATLFWTVFDHYLEQEQSIHQICTKNLESQGILRVNGKIDERSLSDKQIVFFYDNKLSQKEKMLTLDKEFHQKIKNILSAQSLVNYYNVEKAFKNLVIKKAPK